MAAAAISQAAKMAQQQQQASRKLWRWRSGCNDIAPSSRRVPSGGVSKQHVNTNLGGSNVKTAKRKHNQTIQSGENISAT